MKWSIALAFAAAMLVGNPSTGANDTKPRGKMLQFKLRVCEGDPRGSREAGTLKILSEPTLMSGEHRHFAFQSGADIAVADEAGGVVFIPIGRSIEGRPDSIRNGKVRLDVILSSNTPVDTKRERTQFHNRERVQFHSESTRTITTVGLGEVLKLQFGKNNGKQVWVEMSVDEVKE